MVYRERQSKGRQLLAFLLSLVQAATGVPACTGAAAPTQTSPDRVIPIQTRPLGTTFDGVSDTHGGHGGGHDGVPGTDGGRGSGHGRVPGTDGGHDGGGPPWQFLIPFIAVTTTILLAMILDRTSDSGLAKDLEEHGPQLPTEFPLSHFNVVGFVSGSWPMVIDYHSERAKRVSIKVTSASMRDPYTFEILGHRSGRQLRNFRLPPELGDEPVPGAIEINATEEVDGRATPVPIRIFGIGAGPRAVGSVAIDQVSFKLAGKLQAQYSYNSHSAFSLLTPEVLKLTAPADKTIAAARIRTVESTTDVRRGRSDLRTWNCTTDWGATSYGNHLLQVRAWFNSGDKEWVGAWSDDIVNVVP